MALFLHSFNIHLDYFPWLSTDFLWSLHCFEKKNKTCTHCCHFSNYKLHGYYFHYFKLANERNKKKIKQKKLKQRNETKRKRNMDWQIKKIKLNWPRNKYFKSKIKCKELNKQNYQRKLFRRFKACLWSFCGLFFLFQCLSCFYRS